MTAVHFCMVPCAQESYTKLQIKGKKGFKKGTKPAFNLQYLIFCCEPNIDISSPYELIWLT